ncbi:2-polyprenyl-6-methoxyphenol hydroxylase-like FAD-dependent oxidoreductase [Mumia flava]|uniref:2-polyprenyl-6-methoxyphenol hydroxylase-like FAD-dependent oxidoreductase n=1 Tax=Mumia flava TaxID=1348852 RepID=A0A0B2B0I7_9ACTN|nr:FAD-dependent monooxygenase [Mumia flava]PJJ54373.1 2-polyprenyl-6-methoxyphenol hydroxylase-like FAD-dependent oxidoreductase [Mumia flava]
MSAVRSVLVVGAGAAGTATAILLADQGVSVDLVDVKPDVGALGSGITVQGNALRVLRQLCVWEQARAHGYPYDTLGLRAPDPDGTLLVEMPDGRTGGPDLPATMGMERPALARILTDRAVAAGAKLRLGTTFETLDPDDDGVDVTFTDGSRARYDLVVGADGVRSATRAAIGIDLETRATGMGIWRAFVPRPDSVTRTDLYYGGRCYIAGYCPTAEDSMYAYLVEDAQDRSGLSPEESLEVMRDLASSYHGPWDDIRAVLTDPSRINYTHFEAHVLEGPWNRGRVVVIGDAAHTCPPTLAQGAAQALEDAAVLAELLLAADAVDDALWDTFTERRYERARAVVEASVQLGQWMLDGEQGDVPGLMGRIGAMLTEPA